MGNLTDPTAAVLLGALRFTAAAAANWAAGSSLAAWAFGGRHVRLSDRFLATFLASALLITWTVALLGFFGALGVAGILAVSAALPLVTRAFRNGVRNRFFENGVSTKTVPDTVFIFLPAFAIGALVLGVDAAVYLATPPTNWDAMTYHLYFPVRWLQEGRILHVPTVFSDDAAAFAPQNGALLYAWAMALLGADALCDLLPFLALVAMAAAVHRLGRAAGARPAAAAMAAATVFWIPPLRREVASADVDSWMLAFWLVGLVWLIDYLRRPRPAALVACGLASGLALGTKTVGLPLAALNATLATIAAASRRRPAALLRFAVGLVAGGGWWYLRNAWLYGNPLFPLSVALGPWTLPGAYGLAAVRAGEFHIVHPVRLVARVLASWGAPTCVLLVAGLVALGWQAAGLAHRLRGARASAAAVILGEAVTWGAWYVWGVPHNAETRFLLPTLLAALPGWALVLDRAARWRRSAEWGLAVTAVAVLAFSGRPWQDWIEHVAAFQEAGAVELALGASAALLLAAVAAAAAWWQHRPVLVLLALFGFFCATAFGTLAAETSRAAFLARSSFRGWAEGILPLQDPVLPPLRVAYTGANVPYALVGPRLRHRVVYCNTRGEAADGFYEFWRRDPRVYAYHKPGIYRGADDSYDVWLGHLRAESIDLVAIFALYPAERRYLPATPEGFPIEQRWAAEHPERFQPVALGHFAEIYRVSWEEGGGEGAASPP